MKTEFPQTSATLLANIRDAARGDDSAAWVRFWDLYAGAIRTFAARKGGDENADDIVMTVLGKLVEVLRNGTYTPERGRFHSYLTVMILNEVHMQYRKDLVRQKDKRVSIDEPFRKDGEEELTYADVVAEDERVSEKLDDDMRQALLQHAITHVLTKTAISERDRNIYREYAQDNRNIGEVAEKYGVSRNLVSQIKTRIEKRIIETGKRFLADFGESGGDGK